MYHTLSSLLSDEKFIEHWHDTFATDVPQWVHEEASVEVFKSTLVDTLGELAFYSSEVNMYHFSNLINTFAEKLESSIGYTYDLFIAESHFLEALRTFPR